MNAQLMEALADVLADALLADLETEEEQSLAATLAESPRFGSQSDRLAPVSSYEPDAA
jgi:hypothetical protein